MPENWKPVPLNYTTELVPVETLQVGDAVELEPNTPMRVLRLKYNRFTDTYRVARTSVHHPMSLVAPRWRGRFATGALVRKIVLGGAA